jgi:hypothetical protein
MGCFVCTGKEGRGVVIVGRKVRSVECLLDWDKGNRWGSHVAVALGRGIMETRI